MSAEIDVTEDRMTRQFHQVALVGRRLNPCAEARTAGLRLAVGMPGRVSGGAQNVRTGRMIRLRRVAFLLPSALSKSLDSSQSPYSAWSARILRAASRASRDVPRGRYTTR